MVVLLRWPSFLTCNAVFLFCFIWGWNRAPFPMPKSIFFPQLLLKNSQLENLEKLKLKFSTNMKIFDLFFFCFKDKEQGPTLEHWYVTGGGRSLGQISQADHKTFTVGCHPTVLHIKVWLPILLCAIKTVEGDFRFCWTISPNVGQTHKENPNLVRIFYMIFTLNDTCIYKQYNKVHKHWYTKISSLHWVEDRNPPQNASDLYMKYWSYAGPVHASAVWTDEKKIRLNYSYRIFIVCRSPVSPVFWAWILLS